MIIMNTLAPQWVELIYPLMVYGFLIVWILKFSFWIAKGIVKVFNNTIDPDNTKY